MNSSSLASDFGSLSDALLLFRFGKGHTGYKSFNHLPLQLGFDKFAGFLGGAQSHFATKRWEVYMLILY